jgi:hypothetical protein
MHAYPVKPLRSVRTGALVAAVLVLIPPSRGLAAPAADSCLPRETLEDRTAVLAGTTDDGADWVAGFGIDERGIQLVCVGITLDGEEATRGVLGGPFEAAPDDDEIVVSALTTGYRGGPRWHALRGTVTDRAERVELSVDGAAPVDAEIAATGPENGWRWYAVVVPADDAPGIPHVTAIAYNGDDEIVAEGDTPF